MKNIWYKLNNKNQPSVSEDVFLHLGAAELHPDLLDEDLHSEGEGTTDWRHIALPILTQYNVPLTMCVGGFIEFHSYWVLNTEQPDFKLSITSE